jgi:hypothetical protein
VAKSWIDLREGLEAAAAGERRPPSGLDVLQANLKTGAEPDLIALAKRKIIRAGLVTRGRGEPPRFHEYSKGQLVSIWRIHDQTCLELNSRLKPDMKTLETGGGLSTVIFAAKECHHTCIISEQALGDRISGLLPMCKYRYEQCFVHYFQILRRDPPNEPVRVRSHIDSGCHGFPTVFVDFYYATRALKLGGTLIVDDMHIYTCNLIARFMHSDPGWKVDLVINRVAFGIKISDTLDYEWTAVRCQCSESILRTSAGAA